MLKIKRIYEPADSADGYRILVDRIWPRGVSKEAAAIDIWLKDVAPSTALRKWFGHDPARWSAFKRRYADELSAAEAAAAVERIRRAMEDRATVTLLFSARDEAHNQAVALREYLSA